MRVCTDCHFSLQTVTVASASAVVNRGGGGGDDDDASVGSGGVNSGGVDNTGRGDEDSKDGSGGNGDSVPRSVGDSGGVGGGAVEVVPEGGLGVGGSSAGDGGAGLDFVESLEAVYLTEEIAGDVVLGDVLEWGRIQVSLSVMRRGGPRRSSTLHVGRACLVCFGEFVHSADIGASSRQWRFVSLADG